MSTKEIRRLAFSALSRCWVEAEFILLTMLSILGALLSAYALIINKHISEYDFYAFVDAMSNVRLLVPAIVLLVIDYIASTPLYYGIKWCFLQQAGGKSVPVSCIFSCYSSPSRWVRAVKLRLAVDIRKLIVLIPIVCALGAEIELLTRFRAEGEAMHMLALMAIFISIVILSMIYTRVSNKYSMVPYMFAADPDMPVKEMLRKGIGYGADNKSFIYNLKLSFFPYTLMCILIFPIFFVYPYKSMSMAVAADIIINKNEKKSAEPHRRHVKRSESPASVTGGANV